MLMYAVNMEEMEENETCTVKFGNGKKYSRDSS